MRWSQLVEHTYGTDEAIAQHSAEELKQFHEDAGIDVESGYSTLQAMLRQAEGRARLAAAREQLRSEATLAAARPVVTETRESLIDQIRALLSQLPGAGVYARKWEDSTLEDLRSLRDQLKRTAERAAEREKNG